MTPWLRLRCAVVRASPGSSCLPRHIGRSRNGRGDVNRLLVFRQASVNPDVFVKRREQSLAFFQRLNGTFRRGNERAELLQRFGLRVELVQPQELSLLVDLQKPPLPVFVQDRKSTRLNSSHQIISYAVFC